MKPGAATTYRNNSLTRAFQILEALGPEPTPLQRICERTGLHKATAYRFLSVLCDLGYTAKTEDGSGYILGSRLYQLSLSVRPLGGVQPIVRPYLASLAQALGETVQLGMLEHDKVFFCDGIEAEHGLRTQARIGTKVDAHATGVGKVLLAQQAVPEVQRLYAGRPLAARTIKTITDVDALLRTLTQIRAQGYGFDNEEFELGVRSVAMPVVAKNGRAICALAVSGPAVRLGDTALPGIIAALRAKVGEIEAALVAQAH